MVAKSKNMYAAAGERTFPRQYLSRDGHAGLRPTKNGRFLVHFSASFRDRTEEYGRAYEPLGRPFSLSIPSFDFRRANIRQAFLT